MGRFTRMRSFVLLVAVVGVALVAAAPFLHEDPLDMADQMLEGMGLHTDADASLGEAADAEDDASTRDWNSDGSFSEAGAARLLKALQVNRTSTGCQDAYAPALCHLKSKLCDDPARRTVASLQCARTCGVCKKLQKAGKKSKCLNGTPYCMNYKKHCHLSTVKAVCPQLCGTCKTE